MEEFFDKEKHSDELDIIYNSTDNEISRDNFKDHRIIHNAKLYFRFLRRLCFHFAHKNNKAFKNIIYLTTSTPPFDFISAFRQQYPDKYIKVIVPISDFEEMEDMNIDVEFFFQNKIHTASLYKIKNDEHIDIFGIYSEAIVGKEYNKFEFLAPFMKAARQIIKQLQPDIVHSDNLPFFLGSEFEPLYPPQIKIVQVIRDFNEFENMNIEPFWAAINLANHKNLKKLYKDKIIKQAITSLCALPKNSQSTQEMLDFVYNNYCQFYNSPKDENENFKNELAVLNKQIKKLFPQMQIEKNSFYNPLLFTLNATNCWVVISKTYHKDVLTKPELSGNTYNSIFKTKNKSTYVSYGCKLNETNILQDFNTENFRDLREKNKKYLIREFSSARIKINFISPKLFENKNYTIKGFLDSTIEAPLIFCEFSSEIFSTGADIGLTAALNLLVQNNNVQIIVNIPDGLNNPHVISWVQYLEKNKGLDGRWMFIDGDLNLPQFYASSDITLLPAKKNPCDCKHYIAMHFGCIPVASKVGIYNDTIKDIYEDITNGSGFKTQDNNDLDVFSNFYVTTIKAIDLYNKNKGSWNLLIKNAMNYDSSWSFEIIERYNKIYNLL